jgi:protocatechuate 3,4-dioxygenase beta subunit
MKKYFILPLLLVLAVGLSAPLAFAQTTGSVKGVCKDSDGKPIAQAEVEWTSTETGHKYTLKTNNKGEYFSLGVVPGKYNVKLSKDGKQLFHPQRHHGGAGGNGSGL